MIAVNRARVRASPYYLYTSFTICATIVAQIIYIPVYKLRSAIYKSREFIKCALHILSPPLFRLDGGNRVSAVSIPWPFVASQILRSGERC